MCLNLTQLQSQQTTSPGQMLYPRSFALKIRGGVYNLNPLFIAVPGALTAAGALAYGVTHPRAQLFGKTICRTNSARKLVLTFDDGPNPAITPKLLDLLDRYNAKATFFLIGRYVRECPELR